VEAETDNTKPKCGILLGVLQGQQHRVENIAQDQGSLTSLS
jgi:hypothetical protein